MTEVPRLRWGKYTPPPLLVEMANALRDPEQSGRLQDGLGVYLVDEPFHYSRTPLDAIPFAATGGNGDHFALLTDFGFAEDLERAPVIFVQPAVGSMLFAESFADFWSMLIYTHCAYLNIDVDDPLLEESADTWAEILEEMEDDEPGAADKRMAQYDDARELLRGFGVVERDDALTHIEALNDARRAEAVDADEGLGVRTHHAGMPLTPFDYAIDDPAVVEAFLQEQNVLSRLCFYRRMTAEYVLADGFHGHVRDMTVPFLRADGYEREADVLAAR